MSLEFDCLFREVLADYDYGEEDLQDDIFHPVAPTVVVKVNMPVEESKNSNQAIQEVVRSLTMMGRANL